MEPTARPDNLRDFLSNRGVADEFIDKLEHEKIDPSVIPLMNDSDLAKYIPKSGDRIAAVAFCRSNFASSSNTSRRDNILTRLRQRLATGGSPPKNATWVGNRNAEKKERRVELGWMDFDVKKGQYKQVKAIKGGGTRHLSIDKKTTVGEIRGVAENIFFPDGTANKKQKLSHFSTEIQSSQVEVEDSNTVEQLYSKSRVRILRLYLCTKVKDETEEDDSPETHPTSSPAHVAPSSPKTSPHVPQPVNVNPSTDMDDMEDMFLLQGDFTLTSNEGAPLTVSVVLPSVNSSLMASPEPSQPEFSEAGENDVEETGGLSPQATPVIDLTEESQQTEGRQEWEMELATNSDKASNATLIIRRGHCLTDLIKSFKDRDILGSDRYIKMRLPNGQLEEGEGIWVFRDCLTEFWSEFYDSCTVVKDAKVPFIRHDFQLEEWQAVARIMTAGWRRAEYFPVKLAAPFLEEILYEQTTSSCKDSFLQYVSDQERQVLLRALEDFESVEMEELIDILDVHECYQLPKKENLVPLLSQLGHKCLIQAPQYIHKCWRPIVQAITYTLPIEALHELLRAKIPTSKAVTNLLQFPEEMTEPQKAVVRYLNRYIVEADQQTLQNFLRFCTGSNLVGETIQVEFIDTSDFQRRPQAHTCGCVLKLPMGYLNYPDLRYDFNKVLTSAVWVMDIV